MMIGLFTGETTAVARAAELVNGDLVLIAGLRVGIAQNRRWTAGQVLLVTTLGVRMMRSVDDPMARIMLKPPRR